jgi:hypothetical protein
MHDPVEIARAVIRELDETAGCTAADDPGYASAARKITLNTEVNRA